MPRLPRLALALTAAACTAACAPARTPASPAPTRFFWRDVPVGRVHTLMPTPRTVVNGGYDPSAAPALRVASGDEVVVGAVSTCGTRLLQPGADSGSIEPAIRAITAAVRDSTLRRGPGGHVLTGPIHVEGADSGDVLEVRIAAIDLDLPYACNSFGPRSGFIPEDFPGTSRSRIVPLDRARMIGRFSDSLGIEIPLRPFFGSIGRRAGARARAHPQRAAGHARRKPRQQGARRGDDPLHPRERARRAAARRRRARGAGGR